MTSDHGVAGSNPSGCKSAYRANLQAIKEAEKSLEERKYLPKFCHFLGEPPPFFGFAALKGQQNWACQRMCAEGLGGWHAHEAEINLSPTDHGIVAHRR